MKLSDNPRAYAIMGCARRVHAVLGRGFLESTYGDALGIKFRKAGIPYVREDAVRIFYDGQELPTRYRADFTCFDGEYVVELKAIKTITNVEWS
ncbi:MAG: GxxExxY protein [Kiritimatiellia bacterium]